LGRNAGHLKLQLSDILTRPGSDQWLGKLEILLPGKYVCENVWSFEWSPLGGAMPASGAKVDANDANIFASEAFTTEGAGGRETRRSFGNDLLATT
jgi:hypothetical protein